MAALTVEVFEEKMDSFAQIVKRGFDAVDKRFDGIDQRFDGIDREFGVLRSEMKVEFARVDNRIGELAKHVDDFVQLHQKLDIEPTALRHKYELLDVRVARLEGTPA